jgi:ion channel-forming bestrophin family protein
MAKSKFHTADHLIKHVINYRKKQSKNGMKKRSAHFGGELSLRFKWAQFVCGLLRYRGTILSQSWIPTILGLIMGAIFKVIFDGLATYSIPTQLFGPISTLTAFLLVFRTNLAYSRFDEGRKKLGAIVASFSLIVKFCIINGGKKQVNIEEVVRKINLAFAFLRQDLRESRVPPGINNINISDSDKEWKRLFAGGGKHATCTFWVDYDFWGAPQMKDIVTEEEIKYYSILKPNARVLMALTAIGQEVSSGYFTDVVNVAINAELSKVESAWRSCCRIIDTPFPFVYNHLLHFMLFIFCYLVGPIVYAQELRGRTFLLDYILCIVASGGVSLLFYGTNAIGQEIENPFGWQKNDHNISRFCKILNKEMGKMLEWHMNKMMVPESSGQALVIPKASLSHSNASNAQQSKYVASNV